MVDPPVGTLGRPFIILFLRWRLGSSHDPARIAVAENSLTCWVVAVGALDAVGRRTVAEGREARRGLAGDILSAWKAPSSADEVVGLIVVELAGLGGLEESRGVDSAPKKTRQKLWPLPAPSLKKRVQQYLSIRRMMGSGPVYPIQLDACN